jgi:2-polyprenyl-3-methyl-5-hydroxy-6-metoxy-1,4-benzoquinol methylase
MSVESTYDKAGRGHWNSVWTTSKQPRSVDLTETGVRNHFRLALHKLFCDVFGGLPTPQLQLLEIGCGNSIWLPYFARQFQFKVSGLDYSEEGCRTARERLDRSGVPGTIHCMDVFARPADLRHQYDVVVSFGVVEHFQDVSVCLAAFGHYVKPGGLILTLVPNLAGIIGDLVKVINPSVYAIHVPLDVEGLRVAHERAGFTVQRSEYFFGLNLGVINLVGAPADRLAPLRRVTVALCKGLTAAVWKYEQRIRPLPPSRYFSPYIVCIARA